MTKKPSKLPNLEESLAEISQLVEKMEHGEQNLEQSLTHFERGIVLVKHCQKILEDAEQKVQILTQQNTTHTLQPYGEEDDNADSDEHED